MQIRLMNISDIESVLLIQKETGFQEWTESQFREELSLKYALVLVAEIENQIKGFAVFHQAADEVELLSIAVHLNFQRSGVASALLDFAENFYAGKRVTYFLEVRFSNESAKSFYLKNGFKEIGIRSRYYPDGEDAVLMKKEITDFA